MSKIDELIKRLCPNGVALILMKDVSEIKRGDRITKKNITSDGDYIVMSGGVNPMGRYSNKNRNANTITISSYGAAGYVNYIEEDFWANDVCLSVFPNEEVLNKKYLYYVLKSKQQYIFDNTTKAIPDHIPTRFLEELPIPIPPLEVQSEIVRILDNFTELTANLTAELASREKQYEYYSRSLLSFDERTPRRKLCDIATFTNGKGHEKLIVADGRFVVVNSKFISTDGAVKKYSDVQACPVFVNDILMVMSDLPNGKALAKCYLVNEDDIYTLNQRIGGFHVKDENVVQTKFLYYVLNRNQQLLRYDNGVDQTNLRKNDILDIDIPIPDLKTQKNIIRILDSFSAVCKDTSIGLPAEIEARNRQYEFYRDRLLTFDELKVA